MAIGSSKLNEYKVKQIKELFEITNLKDSEIAKIYGVSRTTIYHIRTGKRWNFDTRSYISKIEIDLYDIKI